MNFRLLVILLFSCQNLDKKPDFYNYTKSWDLWRVPILKPYEIVSPTEAKSAQEWHLIIKKPRIFNKDYFDKVNEFEFQLSGIDSIGVQDSILVFKSYNHYWPKLGGNFKTTFIINAKTGEQFLFSNQHHQRDIKNTLSRLRIEDVQLHSSQKVKDDFQSKMILPKDWKS
jgi:hypothetical protein